MGNGSVEAEDLLLGLLGDQDRIAGRLLADLGATLKPARDLVRERLGSSRSDATPEGHLPFSPEAQEVLRWASRWAFPLGGRDQVGSEHLLAGVVRLSDGACQILRALDVNPDVIRFEIKKRVATPGGQEAGPSLRLIRSVPLRDAEPVWDPEWPLRPDVA